MEQNSYHILSTRELEPALIGAAKAHGITMETRPFLEIRPLHTPQLVKRVHALAECSPTLVFTSANSVQAVSQLLEGKPYKGWKIYCLEGHTRDVVNNLFGSGRILGIAPDSRLLALLILEKGEPGPLVFFCGNRRRYELPVILQEAGVSLEEIIVYETIPLSIPIEKSYDGILFFSPSGAEGFFSVNRIEANTVCFAIGATTARTIASFTHNRIITCAVPGSQELIGELVRYYDTIHTN